MQNRSKFQVIRCAEREMSIVGIFSTPEDAKTAMKRNMAETLECTETDLDAAIKGETEDPDAIVDIDCEWFGVEDNSAWAYNVGLTHANFDWKIFRLTCDGECREFAPGDEEIINATYRSYWSSGAYFDASCKVNLKTHEVFDVGSAGCPSCDDDCYEEDVVIQENKSSNEYEVVSLDRVLDECVTEEALERFQSIKRNGVYWRGNPSLDEVIKQLEGTV